MPTVVAESDLFASTFQRPNNGELADSASLLQFLQVLGNSRRYLYNRAYHGNYDVHRFGAVGDGTTDDYAAVAAAVAAAEADGGGVVWFRPGLSYRLNSELDLEGRVSLRAMKGRNSQDTRLIRNHSANLIDVNFGTVQEETPLVIEGFRFIDLAAVAEPMIYVSDGSVTLRECYFPGFAAGGPLVRMDGGAENWLRAQDCYFRCETGQTAIHHRIGQLRVTGSTFKTATDYSSYLIDVDSTSSFDPAVCFLEGNYFDASDQTTGEGGALLLHGSYWEATATGNTFRTETQDFTAFTWASSFATARRLVERGNVFHLATRHEPNGDPLADDSEVSLQGGYRTNIGLGTTATVPTSRERFTVISTNTTTAPTITLPSMLYVGQKLRIVICNLSVGTWASAPVLSGTTLFLTGVALTGLNSGQSVCIDLEVMDTVVAGTWTWTAVSVSP